jgi:histone deacetylase 11
MRIIYHPRYNPVTLGLQRHHPFDLHKFKKVWDVLWEFDRPLLLKLADRPTRPAEQSLLQLVHSPLYLQSLKNSTTVATALEVPQLAKLPNLLLDWALLKSFRFAVAGSVLAGRHALTHGVAINLAGGFHHACPDRGEGFCLYNDIAITIHKLRQENLLAPDAPILYIDLDAHHGNGVARCFLKDRSIKIFDAFNRAIYPTGDATAMSRVDHPIPLAPGTSDKAYLDALKENLPHFIDAHPAAKFAIYNAGTDIVAGDSLGGMNVSLDGVVTRDRYVLGELQDRRISTLMLTSGGYSPLSYKIISETVARMMHTKRAG